MSTDKPKFSLSPEKMSQAILDLLIEIGAQNMVTLDLLTEFVAKSRWIPYNDLRQGIGEKTQTLKDELYKRLIEDYADLNSDELFGDQK